jgi:hypothetical protein
LTGPPSRRSFARRSPSTVLASRSLRRRRSPRMLPERHRHRMSPPKAIRPRPIAMRSSSGLPDCDGATAGPRARPSTSFSCRPPRRTRRLTPGPAALRSVHENGIHGRRPRRAVAAASPVSHNGRVARAACPGHRTESSMRPPRAADGSPISRDSGTRGFHDGKPRLRCRRGTRPDARRAWGFSTACRSDPGVSSA